MGCQCKFLKKGAHQTNVRRSFSSSEIHSSKTNLSHPFPLTRSSEFFSTNLRTTTKNSLSPYSPYRSLCYFFLLEYTYKKIIPQFISRYKTDPNLPKNILIFFSLFVSMRRRKNKTNEKSITEDLSNLEHFVFLEESKKCVFQNQ